MGGCRWIQPLKLGARLPATMDNNILRRDIQAVGNLFM
jgi:hypothetical protein